MNKVILIDKPLKWTSFDVVRKIRNMLSVKKIGHAGTLDPLATGLLILCTGKMTKQISVYQAQEKEYIGTFVLGKTTPSYDLETKFDSNMDWTFLNTADIEKCKNKFLGDIQQIPPQYSAVKKNGKRAFELARKGKEVKLAPKPVTIHEFEFTSINLPEVAFRIVCSKGTYIRSIAHDFGQFLGTGAYLSALRRTRIGEYHVDNAQWIETYASGNQK